MQNADLNDEDREKVIDLYRQLSIGSDGIVRRYFYDRMVEHQNLRSAAQVEKLEREKNLRPA